MPTIAHLSSLSTLVEDVSRQTSCTVKSLLVSDVGTPSALHISLSAPLILRTKDRDDFVKDIRGAIHRTNQSEMASNALTLRLSGLRWAANFERNRWFLAVGIARPAASRLNELLRSCNEVAISRGLPALYMNPDLAHGGEKNLGSNSEQAKSDNSTDRFHFSIAWTLDDPLPHGQLMAPVAVSSQALEVVESIEVNVQTVKVKIGNCISSLPFSP